MGQKIEQRKSIADRVGNVLLVTLSPVVLCWTLYSFWRLAVKGTLWVRDHGRVIEVSGGFNFWVTLWLYFVLLAGSIVVLLTVASWLVRKLKVDMNSGDTSKTEIDELTRSFFGLFSNVGGVKPDLDRIFDLFVPQGLIAKCGALAPEISTLKAFITPRQALLSDGSLTDFAEVETSERTYIFGSMAQRLSTYEKSGSRDGVPFVSRGVKSFQFVRTVDGWRILSMAWDDERDGLSLQELT